MNIVQKFKSRQRDMKALTALLNGAISRSTAAGDSRAGAHLLALSALGMPDGAAKRALANLGTTETEFVGAIESLEADTLADLGLTATGSNQTHQGLPNRILNSRAALRFCDA